MIDKTNLIELITKHIPCEKLDIEGEGNKFTALIVSEAFENCSPVKRQQMIYEILNPYFTSGALHAFSMQTLTPTQWKKQHG